MNKNYIIYLVLVSMSLLLISCQSEKLLPTKDHEEVIDIESNGLDGFPLGVYSWKYTGLRQINLGIQLSRDVKGDIYGAGLSADCFSHDFEQRINGGDFYVNEIPITYANHDHYLPEFKFYYPEGFSYREKSENYEIFANTIMNQIMGNETRFSLIHNDIKYFDKIFYVPEELELLNVAGMPKSEAGTSTFISRNETILYNVDPKNRNGLLIIMSWGGDMYEGDLGATHDDYVYRVAHFPEDDGDLILSNEFFDGIPKHAWFTLFIIRGTMLVFDSDADNNNNSYYIYCKSKVKGRFILSD